MDEAEQVDWGAMLGYDDEHEMAKRLESMLRRLKGLAGGRVSVMREMRELDNRFGLNAKAMADLRWSVEQGEKPEAAAASDPPAEVRRLRAIDPAA